MQSQLLFVYYITHTKSLANKPRREKCGGYEDKFKFLAFFFFSYEWILF